MTTDELTDAVLQAHGQSQAASVRAFHGPRFLPIVRTFLGDFNPQKLPSRGLQTLWEWKNRVLLEEYYIFNVVIPLEVE